MSSHKAAYTFYLDSITQNNCTGWYSRCDEKDKELLITVNGIKDGAQTPNIQRPDVAEAGAGTLISGFAYTFKIPIKEGDRIEFWSAHAELMLCTLFQTEPERYSSVVKPEIEEEEEEEDIFDVYLKQHEGQALKLAYITDMQNTLHSALATRLSAMRQCFTAEQVEVLQCVLQDQYAHVTEMIAGLQTEIHAVRKVCMTSAEYRQQIMPKLKKYKPITEIDIPLSGDITGANWWNTEPDGRWTGPERRSSLMVPALKPGKRYDLWVEIVDEFVSGAVDTMEIAINSMLVSTKRDTKSFPATLYAWFEIEENYRFPFWILHLDVYKMGAPSEHDKNNKDTRQLGVHIKRVVIKPQPEDVNEDDTSDTDKALTLSATA